MFLKCYNSVIELNQRSMKKYETSMKMNEKVYIDFDKKDLLEFDSTCSNYFTINSK